MGPNQVGPNQVGTLQRLPPGRALTPRRTTRTPRERVISAARHVGPPVRRPPNRMLADSLHPQIPSRSPGSKNVIFVIPRCGLWLPKVPGRPSRHGTQAERSQLDLRVSNRPHCRLQILSQTATLQSSTTLGRSHPPRRPAKAPQDFDSKISAKPCVNFWSQP